MIPINYVDDARYLRSVANVQAFGIYDSTDPGTISQSQLDFVDSDNAVILSNASELETALGKSGLITYLDRIELLNDGNVVETIQPNQLTDNPLGLSFTSTINNLDVSLNAQNQITAKAYFTNGTAPATLDFTVASGLEESTSDPLTNIIAGTPGDDVIYLGGIDLGADGDAGKDKIIGNKYDNDLNGGDGNDTIFAHEGNDTLIGGSGNDALIGSTGNDTLNGLTGIDTLIGGEGDDNYTQDHISDTIIEETNAGYDTVQTLVNWTLADHLEKLLLKGELAIDGTGNALDNLIIGNTANNNLTGGDGLDTLNGSTGNDTMIGGAGDDTYLTDSSLDVITESLN
jgi:Ca2+-binding RTX toxin-like protein